MTPVWPDGREHTDETKLFRELYQRAKDGDRYCMDALEYIGSLQRKLIDANFELIEFRTGKLMSKLESISSSTFATQ